MIRTRFKVFAKAKLNLNLHLLPEKNEGLFPVQYINCELDLCDKLLFNLQDHSIRVECNFPGVPKEKNNLAYKAATLLKSHTKTSKGVKIVIEKHIPVRAGLGGGSSDAAATLRALVKLWSIKISSSELLAFARKLGNDVCYSLIGGFATVKEDGSSIYSLGTAFPSLYVVILVPFEEKPSTRWCFQQLIIENIGKNIQAFEKTLKAIRGGNTVLLLENLHNDFEEPLSESYPIITKMKAELSASGAKATILCGAGLATVGFYADKKTAESAQKKLNSAYKSALLGKLS